MNKAALDSYITGGQGHDAGTESVFCPQCGKVYKVGLYCEYGVVTAENDQMCEACGEFCFSLIDLKEMVDAITKHDALESEAVKEMRPLKAWQLKKRIKTVQMLVSSPMRTAIENKKLETLTHGMGKDWLAIALERLQGLDEDRLEAENS
jgi:hypothetical protein